MEAEIREPPSSTLRVRTGHGFTPERLATALERHSACLAGAGPGRVLKDDPARRVTQIDAGGPLVVKEYVRRGRSDWLKNRIRPAPARREWNAAHRLARLGIPALRVLALAEPRCGRASAFVVSELLEGCHGLGEYVVRTRARGPRHRRRLVSWFAEELAGLHRRGVHHADLKASNVLVRESDGGWQAFLVDLGDVRVGRRVGYRRRATCLAQLNASIPRLVTTPDRLRFLRRYAEDGPRLPPVRRVWRDVARLTRARHCVWDADYGGHESRAPAAPQTGG